MSTISDMEQHLKELDSRIADLQRERKRVHGKLLKAKSPFKAGDVIEWDTPHNGTTRSGTVVGIIEDDWRVRVARRTIIHLHESRNPRLKASTEAQQ